MAMDPLRRVANLWNWLPAFRVVAEYQSIQQAAAVLNLSPSALSRTVRLLEEATNELLFVRSATGLTLTTFGAELLRGTREAMRRVDDVFVNAQSRAVWERVLVTGAAGAVPTRLLERALCAGIRQHDDVCYRMTQVDEAVVAAELLRGNLDVALVESSSSFEVPADVTAVHLGELDFAVLAPPGHGFANETGEIAPAALADAKMVLVAGSAAPARVARVVATVASVEAAESLAQHGPFLCHLPVPLAEPSFRVVARSDVRVSVTAVFRTPLDGELPVLVRDLVARVRAIIGSPP